MVSKIRSIKLRKNPLRLLVNLQTAEAFKIPDEEHIMNVRMRKIPKKSVSHALKQVNTLIGTGAISDLKFREDGSLIGASIKRNLSKGEEDALRRVVTLSHEQGHRLDKRAKPTPQAWKTMREHVHRIKRYEREGQFTWLHPSLENAILEGKNVELILTLAQHQSGANTNRLREKIKAKLSRPQDVKANLKKQLIYFRDLLNRKKQRELVIDEDFSEWDSTTTTVYLAKGTVFRESWIVAPKVNETARFVVELPPNGVITIHNFVDKMRK